MSDEQPQAKPSAKPRYTLDDAGILSRTVGTETTALAIWQADGRVSMLDGMAEFEPNVRRVLERMGKKIERLEYAPSPEAPHTEAVPLMEPATEPHLGERTPVWLAWCKQADPQRFDAVCKRLKISDQP